MKKFQRKVEDFICAKCGAAVRGNGYTNHCPKCLYSMDVDVNPGDRASNCGGLMEPILVRSAREGYVITHRCLRCGKTRDNRSVPDDSFDVMLEVMRKKSP